MESAGASPLLRYEGAGPAQDHRINRDLLQPYPEAGVRRLFVSRSFQSANLCNAEGRSSRWTLRFASDLIPHRISGNTRAGHSQRNIFELYTERRPTRRSSTSAAAKARQTPSQECSAQQAAHAFHALHGIPGEMGPNDGVAHQLVAMRMHLCSAAMDLHVQHRNAL